MKKSNIILAFFLVCVNLSIAAQSKIWIMGNVYTEEQGKQTTIPFATISIYDYKQQNELKYFKVCGPHGNYNINPYDYKKQYHFIVEAPGFKTKEFNLKAIPEVWNGKPFSGNCNVNILMERQTDQAINNTPRIYKLADLKKRGKAQSLTDLLCLVPEIQKDGDSWVTKQGEGSVCLFLNGIHATPKTLSKFDEIPSAGIASIEYYQLPEGGIYDATVNITLIVGKPATAPTYKLKPSRFIF